MACDLKIVNYQIETSIMLTTVAHHPPGLKEGDLVKVKVKFPIGHYRVPTYIRGKQGHISKNLGRYINPEEEAFGKNAGNKMWYYAVSFLQKSVWPDYTGEKIEN